MISDVHCCFAVDADWYIIVHPHVKRQTGLSRTELNAKKRGVYVTVSKRTFKHLFYHPYLNIYYLPIEGNVDPIASRDLSFLGTSAHTYMHLRAAKLRVVIQEHKITMPVVEFDYTKYPFEITIGSATSLPPPILGKESPCDSWKNTIACTAGRRANIVIRVAYPTGKAERVMTSKIFIELDGDTDISRSDLFNLLYVERVKICGD
jgi:hypothetical protein